MNPTQAQIEALKECADDLDTMINNYYDNTLDYPSQKRKYDSDMEVVKKARSSIDALTAAVCPECKKWENRYAFAKNIYKKEVTDAIERCAQAIKDHPNMTDRAKEQAIAAIKRLK